jgi:hypothetical protein
MYHVGDGECPLVIAVNLISYNLTDDTDKSGSVINTDDLLQRARQLSNEIAEKIENIEWNIALIYVLNGFQMWHILVTSQYSACGDQATVNLGLLPGLEPQRILLGLG